MVATNKIITIVLIVLLIVSSFHYSVIVSPELVRINLIYQIAYSPCISYMRKDLLAYIYIQDGNPLTPRGHILYNNISDEI